MRRRTPGSTVVAVLFSVLLVPRVGNAQVYQFRTPAPQVTAAAAVWQIGGEPILVDGLVYQPTREFRFFDGFVMAQIGVYQGVPVYADTTLAPYGVVYIPVGGDRMRAYEHPRTGDLAGTTGSRAPRFPVTVPSTMPQPPPLPVATAGAAALLAPAPAPLAAPAPTAVESVPPPRSNDGIWIEFGGSRWSSDGPAVPFSADRFARIGSYHGFAVYRERNHGARDTIWVQSVGGGAVAPYRKM